MWSFDEYVTLHSVARSVLAAIASLISGSKMFGWPSGSRRALSARGETRQKEDVAEQRFPPAALASATNFPVHESTLRAPSVGLGLGCRICAQTALMHGKVCGE